MIEHNKAAARAEFDVWSTGAIDRLDDLVARDVVHHDPYDPNAADGLEGLKRTIELNRRATPTCDSRSRTRCRRATRW